MNRTHVKRPGRLPLILMMGFVVLITGCLSPRYFSNKTIDVTNDPAWWGELRDNRVVSLNEDSLMTDGALCGS